MKRYIFSAIFVAILALLLAASCKKDPTKIGLNIQPSSEQMELGNDTLVFFASYTVEQIADSIATDNLDYLILGSMVDPVFGTSQAAFNTQLQLENFGHSFGEEPVVDSIVLQLAYSGRWGDSTTMLTASVYQLTDSLRTATSDEENLYFANSTIGYKEEPIGVKTFLEKPYDSVTVVSARDTVKYAPYLSIKLNNEFGEYLLENVDSLTASNADFWKVLPGIRVAVDPVTTMRSGDVTGKMIYFSPASVLSKMVLYYHHKDETDTVRTYNFPIQSKSIRFNNFETDHSMAQADLWQQLYSPNPSPSLGNERLYLQPLVGTRIKMNFEGLDKLREIDNMILNEVKLVVNVADYDEKLPPPPLLYISRVNEKGKSVPIVDNEPFNSPANYFKGTFDAANKRYLMRITRYIQQRLLDEEMDNDELFLEINSSGSVVNRTVFYGNNPSDAPDKRVKLYMIYSTY